MKSIGNSLDFAEFSASNEVLHLPFRNGVESIYCRYSKVYVAGPASAFIANCFHQTLVLTLVGFHSFSYNLIVLYKFVATLHSGRQFSINHFLFVVFLFSWSNRLAYCFSSFLKAFRCRCLRQKDSLASLTVVSKLASSCLKQSSVSELRLSSD